MPVLPHYQPLSQGSQRCAAEQGVVSRGDRDGVIAYAQQDAYLRHVFTELPKAQSLPDVEALLPTRLDPAALARHSLQDASFNARQ